MRLHRIKPEKSNVQESDAHAQRRNNGFVVFCEKNLRYEKGIKAWIFLGPYLLGAVGLEMIVNPGQARATPSLWPWIGFLTYLIFFPPVWRRILNLPASRKEASTVTVPRGESLKHDNEDFNAY
jgi:hypothetical protein